MRQQGLKSAGLALLLLSVGTWPGCQKSFWVRQYPEFYGPELKAVAVVPFRNETPQPAAGGMFASQLAAAMRFNGTYSVLGPMELREKMEQQHVQPTSNPSVQQDAELLGRLGGVDAFVTGRVLAFDAMQTRYMEWDYPYGYPHYPYSGAYYHWRYWDGQGYAAPYYQYVNRANVAVEVSMVRLSDGKVLFQTDGPLQATVQLAGYSPVRPRHALMEAVDQIIGQLMEDLAVVPVKIKVNPRRDLRTADGLYDGEWDFTDTFPADAEKMYVVLRLPRAADRNTFRMTVSPKGDPEDELAAQEFLWSGADLSKGLEFSPRQIVAGMGPGAYQANFYANGKRVMSRGFRIE